MPPIRSESRQKLANQEGKILLALNDIETAVSILFARQRDYTKYPILL
jgi:hypothetical protein